MLFLKSINVLAQRFPFSCLTIRKECGVESNTASIIEHTNETNNAKNKYAKSVIMFFLSKI